MINELFHKIAVGFSTVSGSPWIFIGAVIIVFVWFLTGQLFQFSDSWQLIINTITSVVTFIMVFLIQNTQNRDSKAIHIKLDELLKVAKGARTSLVDIEDVSDEELERLHREFKELHEHYAKELSRRGKKI